VPPWLFTSRGYEIKTASSPARFPRARVFFKVAESINCPVLPSSYCARIVDPDGNTLRYYFFTALDESQSRTLAQLHAIEYDVELRQDETRW
jgi:hypothetical protein